MEKAFVFFVLLALLSLPLAMMGMLSEMAMFWLVGLVVLAGYGMVATSPEERK